jgi:hypothetical protein
MAVSAEELGTEDIKLLIKQAAPASIDFIHVRQYTSRYYICRTMDRFTCYRVTVVLPITFFISSLEWL